MTRRFKLADLIFGLMILVFSFGAANAKAGCNNVASEKPGEVYLLRGLANIFSLGLDKLQNELTPLGIKACVYNHKRWRDIFKDLVARNKANAVNFPVIIVGHSLGAGAAPKLATELARSGVPVRYVVMMDPVVPTYVGGDVAQIENYYIKAKNKDKTLRAYPDFKGKLQNIDVSDRGVDHFDIDKNPIGHEVIQKNILKFVEEQEELAKAKK